MDAVRSTLTELVQSEGEAFYGDAARVESKLGERAGDHPDEVAVLVTAVRAGVVDELANTKPGLLEIAVGHLAGRMARMYGVDPGAAHWAVESWAQALTAELPPDSTVPVTIDGEYGREASPERKGGPAIPWPWVATIGAGLVGLLALVVLVRMVVGLVHSGGGQGSYLLLPATGSS